MMKRKTYSLLVIVLIGLLHIPVAAQNNNDMKEQIRAVDAFHSLDINGRFTIQLVTGDKNEVIVNAENKLIDLVETDVKNGVLKIGMAQQSGSQNRRSLGQIKNRYSDYLVRKPIEIKITVSNLSIINIAGVSSLEMADNLQAESFYLSIGDASKVSMNLTIMQLLDVYLAGSARLDLKGKTAFLQANIHGASAFTAKDLNSANSKIEITGASRAEIHCTNHLEVDLKGASKLLCTGSPTSVKQHVSMGSSLTIQ